MPTKTENDEKVHRSFRLNRERLEELEQYGRDQAPQLSLTYLVDKAIVEMLGKLRTKGGAK